ncbi:30S ribosomal protein S17 [Candidatus Babeliales bacterium]|nr:30S ribosomal protein S17 [Candidatus Babeliales bacterium]
MSDTSTKRAKQERSFEGYVVSDKMQKTIVVKVQRTFKHPLLGKIIRKSKKYKVHDELMHAKDGDFVKIVETRSLSKTKHMRLVEVIRSVRQGA